MKLRNKKTGKIVDLSVGRIRDTHYGEFIQIKPVACLSDEGSYLYDTFAEFSEDWEDCEPAEPLIKDEKIRKAVRAWAEANGAVRVILGQVNNDELVKKSPMTDFGCHISFEGCLGLERGRNYTITELCGEEEE